MAHMQTVMYITASTQNLPNSSLNLTSIPHAASPPLPPPRASGARIPTPSHTCPCLHSLVAVLFEMFLIAVIMEKHLWVTAGHPVSVLQLWLGQWGFQLLAFPAPGHRS